MTKPTCTIPDCTKPVSARGWCGMHYARWRLKGDPLVEPLSWTDVVCAHPDCDRPAKTRGLCNLHILRQRRMEVLKPGDRCPSWFTIEERLKHVGWTLRVVVPELGECWEWNGHRRSDPPNHYGLLLVKGAPDKYVHRHAYRLWVDPELGDDDVVRHRCDNPPCFKPEHLIAGTKKDNTNDALERRRLSHGADHTSAKLPDDDTVREIRRRYAAGGVFQRELAAEFGISAAQTGRIIRGERWKHVE